MKTKSEKSRPKAPKMPKAPRVPKQSALDPVAQVAEHIEKELRHAFKITVYPLSEPIGFNGHIEHLNSGAKQELHGAESFTALEAFIKKQLPEGDFFSKLVEQQWPAEVQKSAYKMDPVAAIIAESASLKSVPPQLEASPEGTDNSTPPNETPQPIQNKALPQLAMPEPLFASKFKYTPKNTLCLDILASKLPPKLRYRLRIKDSGTDAVLWETDNGKVLYDTGAVLSIALPTNVQAQQMLLVHLDFFIDSDKGREVQQKIFGLLNMQQHNHVLSAV